jgi:protein-disulfide isomerase
VTGSPNPWRRRAVLTGGAAAVAAWIYAAPRLGSLWPRHLVYHDLDGLAPFRELAGTGALSSTNNLIVGLDVAKAPDPAKAARIAAIRADPCAALFGLAKDLRVPVAFFSDFNCPNCRVLETILADYQTANPGVLRLVRFELPLLGAASTTASKAVLAADRQGAYAAMHDRLIRNRMVSDLNLVKAMAAGIGIDGQKLVADMQRPEIETALDQARALADVFGFYGTPGMVIGRTVFLGAIPATDVARIITDELALPPLPCLQA